MPDKKNSAARIQANNKYNAKAYDRINIAVPKGRKDEIQARAAARGESLNGFITKAVDERLERLQAATDDTKEESKNVISTGKS